MPPTLYEQAVETIQLNGYTGYILPDEDARPPWEDDEGYMGSILHWHSQYNLMGKGTEREMGPKEFEELAIKEGYVWLPLALFEHSGMYFYEGTHSHAFDPGGWDSGQVGYLYATPEHIRKLYGIKRITSKVRKRVEQELRVCIHLLNAYYQNDVYGFIIEDSKGETVDSCWGFWPDYVPEGLRGDSLKSLKEEINSIMNNLEVTNVNEK